MAGELVAITLSSNPQRLSRATPGSCTWCVDIVSLGKIARSTTSTRYPLRLSNKPVDEPATRAPITITSYILNLLYARYR